MRFFVPLSNSPNDGERLYETIRKRLQETKEPTAARRIYVLKCQEDGKRRTIAVCRELHRFVDGPVMAIFEGNSTSTYYVRTPRHGGFEGEPYAIPKEAAVEVEEFSALR